MDEVHEGGRDAGGDPGPARLRRSAPLTARERAHVAIAALAPIPVAALGLVPFATASAAGPGDVAFAALVYGGMLGLAAGFVVADRVQARQCPRCAVRNARGSRACADCGYDLATGPRFACGERHGVYVEPGLCDCGRRLRSLAPVRRGISREIAVSLKVGAWLLALLVLAGLLLPFVDR